MSTLHHWMRDRPRHHSLQGKTLHQTVQGKLFSCKKPATKPSPIPNSTGQGESFRPPCQLSAEKSSRSAISVDNFPVPKAQIGFTRLEEGGWTDVR